MPLPNRSASSRAIGEAAASLAAQAAAMAQGIEHKEVLRLPEPPPTGDELLDEENSAQHQIFLKMVDGVLCDRSHIMPLYRKFNERVENQQRAVQMSVAVEERFGKVTTLAGLYKEHPDFVVEFLVARSDMTLAEARAILQKSVDQGLYLLEYETQLPADLKLPKEMVVREVCRMVLAKRGDDCGARLKGFKKEKKVSPDGKVDWSGTSYTYSASKGLLTKVKHRASGLEVDVSSYKISTDYVLQNNWSDFRAVFQQPPLPAIPLVKFFKKPDGPHQIPRYSGGNSAKFVTEIVIPMTETWSKKRNDAKGSNGQREETKAVVKGLLDEKRSKALAEARMQAVTANSAKRARAGVKLEQNKG